MTVTHEIKILDDKIKASPAQYNLSRRAAKISALPSEDLLEKYEYETGEDLGYIIKTIIRRGSSYFQPNI